MLSVKSVNALAHYSDWIIAHVHTGTLGWNGFMAAGTFYWMVPRLFGTKLYSKKDIVATVAFEPSSVGAKAATLSFFGAGDGAGGRDPLRELLSMARREPGTDPVLLARIDEAAPHHISRRPQLLEIELVCLGDRRILRDDDNDVFLS